MPGDRERCLAAGANDYVPKPVSLRKLAALIEAYLLQ
jgi:CheY-like chemotaxis protein